MPREPVAAPAGASRAGRALRRVRTRDGRLVAFDRGRIERAVRRAAREVGRDGAVAAEAASRVVAALGRRPGRGAPAVEEIQDAVEAALLDMGRTDVASAYARYRRGRAEVRAAKRALGVRDELKLTVNAVAVLRERYLLRDARGRVAESTGGMMDRVARAVAAAEDAFRPGAAEAAAQDFAEVLRSLRFLPNSPTLLNAGTELGMLSGCFVLPLEDSLDAIFATLGRAMAVQRAGGGTGFAFSALRPAGDPVRGTGGTASGPVSFMRVFDTATDVLREGGRRRGANMAVLRVSHPDVREFVRAKAGAGVLTTFNLSVAVDDRFMRAALAGGDQRLVNPRTGRTAGRIPARELLESIAEEAWRGGDPGLLFIDRINRANPVPGMGRIEATNPCGEVPLLPNESCNLGSVNLARHLREGRIDWESLARTVRMAVRFLDDVIEVDRHPAPELARAARETRKIGLGMMGLAEALAALGIPYDSEAAVRLAARIARRIHEEARAASIALAAERGPFPRFAESRLARRGGPPLRNAQLTSVAPTGTISIIAGTTSGIEPMFALAFARDVLGTRLLEINPLFERVVRDGGFHSDELMEEIAREGGVAASARLPPGVRRRFVTALEVAPEWHLRMQAAVQRHVDAAVSKTVNLPARATVDDVAGIFVDAWRAGVKGITVYRYGSRSGQALRFLADAGPAPSVLAGPEYAGGCVVHACPF
jgi:ribonucleoside-diphosphate reductase alpha chain